MACQLLCLQHRSNGSKHNAHAGAAPVPADVSNAGVQERPTLHTRRLTMSQGTGTLPSSLPRPLICTQKTGVGVHEACLRKSTGVAVWLNLQGCKAVSSQAGSR